MDTEAEIKALAEELKRKFFSGFSMQQYSLEKKKERLEMHIQYYEGKLMELKAEYLKLQNKSERLEKEMLEGQVSELEVKI